MFAFALAALHAYIGNSTGFVIVGFFKRLPGRINEMKPVIDTGTGASLALLNRSPTFQYPVWIPAADHPSTCGIFQVVGYCWGIT
jgi:hypothetical protein